MAIVCARITLQVGGEGGPSFAAAGVLGIVTSGIEALFNSGAEILAGASLEAIMSKDNRCSQMQMKSLEL